MTVTPPVPATPPVPPIPPIVATERSEAAERHAAIATRPRRSRLDPRCVARASRGWLAALPDGVILRQVFLGLVVVSATMICLDLREEMKDDGADPFGMPSLSPVTMERPERDNQIRPYLPLTRPMAPDETSERLALAPARGERGGADALPPRHARRRLRGRHDHARHGRRVRRLPRRASARRA